MSQPLIGLNTAETALYEAGSTRESLLPIHGVLRYW